MEKNKEKKEIFQRIETKFGRKCYITKLMNDFLLYKINNNKIYIQLRGLFDLKSIYSVSLFKPEPNDEFLGIFFGYKLLKDKVIRKKYTNLSGLEKTLVINKTYHIEIRFRRGSVFIYLQSLALLFNMNKKDTTYVINFRKQLETFVRTVYEYYRKVLSFDIVSAFIRKQELVRSQNIKLFEENKKKGYMRGVKKPYRVPTRQKNRGFY